MNSYGSAGLPRSLLLAILIMGATPSLSTAQVSVDNFDWGLSRSILNGDLNLTARLSYTTFSDALGGETDVIMTMPAVTDTTAYMETLGLASGVKFGSSSGTTPTWLLSYDGIDFSADSVRASLGLRGVDLTADGFLNQFQFRAINNGPPLSTAIVVLSGTSLISQYELPMGTSQDTADVIIPFDAFSPVGQGADFTSVNAIVLIVGSGGGAAGPVDFQLMDFEIGVQYPTSSSTDSVLYNQTNGTPGQPWYTNDFGSSNPYSAEAADDFTIPLVGTHKMTGLKIEGTYISGPAPNPTADLTIVKDSDGGPVGDTLASYLNLPVGSWNPFVFTLPDTGLGLIGGDYWFTLTLNSPPGTEGFFTGSPTSFGNAALWRNPNDGFGYGATSFRPLNELPGNDRSFLFTLTGSSETTHADLAVHVEHLEPTPGITVGDTIRYLMTVSNIGQVESSDTKVVLSFERLEILSTVLSQGSCSRAADFLGHSIWQCELGSLSPDETTTIQIEAIANQAGKVSAGVGLKLDGFPDEVPSNNIAAVAGLARRSISIEKTASGNEFLVGAEITFEVTVTNESDNTVDGVYVEDTFYSEAFAYESDTGGCAAFEPGNQHAGAFKCEIGSLEPGGTRSFEMTVTATVAAGEHANRVKAFSSGGLEDRDEVTLKLEGELAISAMLFLLGYRDQRLDKTAVDPIDVYLNDALLADDIEPGRATPFVTLPLTTYPFRLYLTSTDAPDNSSAFDTLESDVEGVTDGKGSVFVLTTDADDENRVITLREAKLMADDPGGVSFVVVHAAPAVSPVSALLMGTAITPAVIAGELGFGETTDSFALETPGDYNIRVAPIGDDAAAEVYNVSLPDAGQSYFLILAPDIPTGKLDATSMYVVDSQGQARASTIVTSIDSDREIPDKYALYDNYPNPFNPTTTFAYDLPEATDVDFVVFDALGRVVESLVTGHRPSGRHSVTWDAKGATSGVYFYRIVAGSFTASRKMVLVK